MMKLVNVNVNETFCSLIDIDEYSDFNRYHTIKQLISKVLLCTPFIIYNPEYVLLFAIATQRVFSLP